MNAADIIAYAEDGAIICPDCFIGPETEETGVLFIDDADESIGSTCDTCQSFLGPDLDWHPLADAKEYRWPRCQRCNHTQPADNDARTRLSARRGQFACPSCLHPMHF